MARNAPPLVDPVDLPDTPSCSIAATLEAVGDRWTLLILRDLFRGVAALRVAQVRPARCTALEGLAQVLKKRQN